MKKIATHIHTALNSECAKVPAEEAVEAYFRKGYYALTVTNHCADFVFEDYYGIADEKLRIDRFLEGYERAKKVGDELGISVWLGAEVHVKVKENEPIKEFLLYGTDEAFFYENPKLYALSQKELFELCEAKGILMFQAHPFRHYTCPGDPKFMHGIEVFNGHPHHDSRNDLARQWAKEQKLLEVAGDDYHISGNEGYAATLVSDGCVSYKDFIIELKEGRTEAVAL